MEENNFALLINLSQEEENDGVVRYGIPSRVDNLVLLPSHFVAVSGKTKVGADGDCGIQIGGYHVRKEHCYIENDNRNTNIFLTPVDGAETRVNGERVLTRIQLKQFDRVCFGLDTMFYLDTEKSMSFCSFLLLIVNLCRRTLWSLRRGRLR